ncbi:MAG: hypothetical protein ACI4E1_05020 [Lachnospira sp.]
MSTAKKLNALFDYQRFAHNDKLQALIEDTEIRCLKVLTDDDLECVSAAGDEAFLRKKRGGQEDE